MVFVFVALAATAMPAAAPAASGGLAYDEVTRLMQGDATPQPGTFSADFQAAVAATKPATQHRGLFGGLMNAADAMKNAANIVKTGSASTEYFLNGWKRTDDPGAQTATIYRPDRRQIIHLNLAAKTYRIEDMTSASEMETPPPTSPNTPGPAASPQPGTGVLDVSVTSKVIGPKTLEGVPTTGYDQDFKMVASHSTGSCRDGTFEASMVQYVSAFADPSASATATSGGFHFARPSPVQFATGVGCKPKTTFHHAGNASPPSNRLAMWMVARLGGNTQTSQGQVGGGFMTVIERGNVRALGPDDAGLFDVPPGYTKEQ